jgi:ABC-type Fe3+-hydroxamate transport system substrate-binding protein
MRVISLVPSLTETLFAIGAGDSVVGITDYCIFPEGIDRPRVGGTKTPSIAAIRNLEPDLVYVNLEENLKRHADEIATFAQVVATEPKTLDDVVDLIARLGTTHGCDGRAGKLVEQLTAERRPLNAFTFVVPIWKKPWMWCGGDTYVSNLVESVGGRNLLRDRTRYPTLDPAEVLAVKPDIVFLPDEPYAFTAEDAAWLSGCVDRLQPVGRLKPARTLRVIGPFAGHLFTWHGVRTIEGLRFLRRAVPSP